MKNIKLLYSSAVGATFSVWLAVALTIVGEISPPFKAVLKNLTSHHWITKSIVTVLVYLLVMFIVYKISNPNKKNVYSSLSWLISSIIAGVVILFLFFSAHYFGLV